MIRTMTLITLVFCGLAQASLEEAKVAYEQNDSEQALILLEKLEPSVEALVLQARIWLDRDLDEAEELIDAAVEQAPNHAGAHYVRGMIMGNQASNSLLSAISYAGKSLDSFKKAVELAPEDVAYRQGLASFYLQAPGIAGGDPELALEQIEALEKLDSKAALETRLNYLAAKEDEQGYGQQMQQAIAEYGDLPDFYFQAGMALQREENFSGAMEYFRQAVAKTPSNDESRLAWFNALYQIGRTAVISQENVPEGIAALQRFLNETPAKRGIPEAHWARFRLANLYQLSNQDEQAKAIYLALNQIEDDKLASQVKKKLKKL